MTSLIEVHVVATVKRNTVRIEEDLMKAVRERAAAEHVSITRMINRLLRLGLHAPPSEAQPFREKVHDLGQAKVDITKTNAVLAEWDDERFIEQQEEQRRQ